MTFEQMMEKTAASFDTHIARGLEHAELLLRDHGATDSEVEIFMAEQRAVLEAQKAEAIAEIRRGLSDWDAPSGKLQ
jgi:hypothetical protein